MSSFFIYNDKIYEQGESIVSADSRGLKYGDGLFETMRLHKSVIQLRDFHFERLFSGMQLLEFKIPARFTTGYFENKILELCKKNQHAFTRVRIMVFRANGGLYDDAHPDYIIQAWEIEQDKLNSNGQVIDVYPDARKSCDKFANLKSNNFLPYAMAALHAKKTKIDDCLLLNNYNRICDTTIANIFIIKGDIIYTPPLSEGCIAGVMRRFVIEKLKQSNFHIIEKSISIDELKNADEVFLTNSIRGIKWVKQFRNSSYGNNLIQDIHKIINTGDD